MTNPDRLNLLPCKVINKKTETEHLYNYGFRQKFGFFLSVTFFDVEKVTFACLSQPKYSSQGTPMTHSYAVLSDNR